jgi:hypothetical protein
LLKWSLGPKNGLGRRTWQFYAICDKNQGIKVKIDEVTANLVSRSGQPAAADKSGSAQKFVWDCMVDFQKSGCNFRATSRNAQYVVPYDVSDLF